MRGGTRACFTTKQELQQRKDGSGREMMRPGRNASKLRKSGMHPGQLAPQSIPSSANELRDTANELHSNLQKDNTHTQTHLCPFGTMPCLQFTMSSSYSKSRSYSLYNLSLVFSNDFICVLLFVSHRIMSS